MSKCQSKKQLLKLFIIILAIGFCPVVTWGDEFRLVPSLSVKEDYNSNVLYSTEDTKSDFITTISPGVEMVDNTEKLATDLLLRLDRLEYVRNGNLSSTNQTYSGSVGYNATPLLSISAGAGYTRNSNPTLNIVSAGFVSAPVPVNHIYSSASADYKFTEKTEGVVAYNFNTDYYQNHLYKSDTQHGVSAGLVYDFGKYFPTLKGTTNVGYNYISFPDSRTDSVFGTVGFSRDFNESWSASASAGVRYTWSRNDVTRYVEVFQVYNGQPFLVFLPVTEHQKDSGLGWVGNAGLHYKTEHGSGDLTYSRDIMPAYGLNGAAEQNAVAVSSQYRLTYEFSTLFSAGYYALTSTPGNLSLQVIKQHTFRVSPGVRYDFSKDVSLDLSYEYSTVDYPATKTEASRHLVSIRFTVQHAFFE